MSLRGISKLVSSDFFEVMIFLDAFSKTTLFFFLLLYLTDSLCRVFEHEWLIKILHQRYVYFVPWICNPVNTIFLLGVTWSILFPKLQWDPPSLKDISEDMIEYYFSPLSEVQSELVLPTALREPYMWN